jgi:ribosome recycling factor
VESFKAQKKKSEITEDDLKDSERDIQKLTDNYVKEIDAAQAKKDKELLEI